MYTYALSHYSEVCIQLLNQYFGDAVGKVGAYLLRRGRRPMFELSDATGLPIRKVGLVPNVSQIKQMFIISGQKSACDNDSA